MIWYLLYPIRRTTEAPLLSPAHPFRSLLTRYGKCAARHVLSTLLVSIAVAGILIYPFPFLYTTDYTIAAPNIPLHVWTDAQPRADGPSAEPDVIMRTLWVHGSYMRALDRDVLLGALELQDEIFGPTINFNPRQATKSTTGLLDPHADLSPPRRDAFHIANGITDQSWFFHSPLLYWACDADNIDRDPNFLDTVNEKKTLPTSVNVTLRHSIVFSGKKFEDRRLIAADALVITLLHLRDSPVGRQWERKIQKCAMTMSAKWDVFPQGGLSAGSQLFEFQFRPISIQDAALLSVAYSLTVFYFFLSLSKIRAVKSKLGLIITVVAQIIMSILSSLTVCALFQIDLSKIPRAAYPLVLMAMSLENIFRLINAVILTPSDRSTSSRVGYAFGETGPVALTSVTQNLVILWGLSKMVSSGVAAFCTFAAIAILFDFFYLSTFFLSVLSIDVRRTELSDALEKASSRDNRAPPDRPPTCQSMMDAVLQGRIALSTRVAGTIVMLGFVVMAQYHFEGAGARRLAGLFRLPWRSEGPETAPCYSQIHQARSPSSWLRLQDHETAKEVINVIKPSAYSYLARVYDPVVFVMKGANRSPPRETQWFPDAVYDFAHHQLTPFTVTVLILLALVRLLMNYLLWDELAEARDDYSYADDEDEPLISIKSLENGHQLDVVKLQVAPDSHVISVGLDRNIRVWNIRYNFASHEVDRPKNPMHSPFPIRAMAVDDDSTWLAILSTYQVYLWNLAEQRWGPSVAVDLYGQTPAAFFFGTCTKTSPPSIIIVRRNGTMVELWPGFTDCSEYVVCKSPLVCAVTVAEKAMAKHPPEPRVSAVVTLSRHARIHRVTFRDGIWLSSEVRLVGGGTREPRAILSIQGLSSYAIIRSQTVDLVDLESSHVVHTFETQAIRPRSLEFGYQGQRIGPGGQTTVSSLTLAYVVDDEDGDCVVQTYLPGDHHDNICLSDAAAASRPSSCAWAGTKLIMRRVRNPGVWTTLRNGCLIGIRKGNEPGQSWPAGKRLPALAHSGIRRRGPAESSPKQSKAEERWEIWAMTRLEKEGDIETTPLIAPNDSVGLIISELGPIAKVGYSSAAVGFGNIIKVITVGHERFDSVEQNALKAKNLISLGNRRRRIPGSRTRAPSSLHL